MLLNANRATRGANLDLLAHRELTTLALPVDEQGGNRLDTNTLYVKLMKKPITELHQGIGFIICIVREDTMSLINS